MNTDALIPLFLEILDALRLLVPRGWRIVRLPIERSEQGTVSFGPYLADLLSTTPLPTPQLGLTAEDEHAVLDAALQDLLEQLGPARDQAHELHFVQTSRDHIDVSVRSAENSVLAAVALEEKHLQALLFTEELFDLTLRLTPKAERMQTAFLADIAGHDDWTYEQPRRHLALSKGVLPWRDYQAVVIGSWARESETWLWGWANKLVLPMCTEQIAALRNQLAKERGLGVFLRPSLPCERSLAGVLAQLAATQLDAAGVYAANYGPGELFLAVFPQQ